MSLLFNHENNFFPTFFKVCKRFQILSLKISKHLLNLISWLIYRNFCLIKKGVPKKILKGKLSVGSTAEDM